MKNRNHCFVNRLIVETTRYNSNYEGIPQDPYIIVI